MSYLLAVLMVVIICGAQWFFTSRALRSPSHFIGWVSGGYAAKIGLCSPLACTFHALWESTSGWRDRDDCCHYRFLERGDGRHDAQADDERRRTERH